MFLDLSLYSQFCKENAHIIDDCRKYPSHPPHQENFERWVNNHQEGLARKTAIRFRDATRHITVCEFLNKFEEICKEIREYIKEKKFERVFFYVNTDAKLKKSNFWLALYMFPLIEESITHVFTMMSDINILTDYEKDLKTLVILPDDASYSGSQMADNLGGINPQPNVEVMIAVAYVSDYAINYIKESVKETKNEDDMSLNLCIPHATEYFYKFKLDKEMYPAGINNLLYTIYLDHKLPDMVSIYQTTYAIGHGFGKEKGSVEEGEPYDYLYEPLSLVSGCEIYRTMKINPYLIISSEKSVTDLADFVDEMCPFPIYKKISYRFNGERIINTSVMKTSLTKISDIQASDVMSDFWQNARTYCDYYRNYMIVHRVFTVKEIHGMIADGDIEVEKYSLTGKKEQQLEYIASLFPVEIKCKIIDENGIEIIQPFKLEGVVIDSMRTFVFKIVNHLMSDEVRASRFLHFFNFAVDDNPINIEDYFVLDFINEYSTREITVTLYTGEEGKDRKFFNDFIEILEEVNDITIERNNVMIDPHQIYKKVRTYDDLLQTNLDWFNRKINQTFYYGMPWGEIDSDQIDHSITSGENLKNLTKNGVFTVNGQSFHCDDNGTKQRSYVTFFMERDKFVSIVDQLKADDRIWFDVIDANNNQWSTIEESVVTLTSDFDEPYTTYPMSVDWSDAEKNISGVDDYPIIKSILLGENMVFGIVIRKEFCKAPTADAVLLEHI